MKLMSHVTHLYITSENLRKKNKISQTNEPRRQGIYWILTLPTLSHPAEPSLHPGVGWIIGQKEVGEDTGYEHWQFVIRMDSKASLRVVRGIYPGAHAELTRSSAALAYVQKEQTRVEGTQFECI